MPRFLVMSTETYGASCREATQLNHCGSAKYQLEPDLLEKPRQLKSALSSMAGSLALTGRDVALKETSKRECWHQNNTFPVQCLVRHALLCKTLRSGD